MHWKRLYLGFGLLGASLLGVQAKLEAQQPPVIQKQLSLAAKAANADDLQFHWLPSEEEQENGNAVPVLLRMPFEQSAFMRDVFPKLDDFQEMDMHDPKLQELHFDHFASQMLRAGSMRFAEWEFPLRGSKPWLVLLPDIQSMRHFVGRGMTAWIKQRLAKGDSEAALAGMKAQLGCARHCAAPPIAVCHLVASVTANMAFDNWELAIQSGDYPNLYWSFAALGPTLQELGPMIRWELWASPSRLNTPLPPVGDKQWNQLARDLITTLGEFRSEPYTVTDENKLFEEMDRLATEEFTKNPCFSEEDMAKMSREERVMRWRFITYCRMRAMVEPMSHQSTVQVIAAKHRYEAEFKDVPSKIGEDTSHRLDDLPRAILTCRKFERRVRFLQTIESLRDYASKHQGRFPAKLEDLTLPAPNDPFTEKPFLYEANGKVAKLSQADIGGDEPSFEYELTMQVGR